MQTPKKGKKNSKEDVSEDSDFEPTKKKRLRSNLLDAKLSESDSDEEGKSKKKKKGGKRYVCKLSIINGNVKFFNSLHWTPAYWDQRNRWWLCCQ